MKVLTVHNRYVSKWFSGEDLVVDAEVELLRRHGHDVHGFERYSDDIRGPVRLAGAAVSTVWSREARRDLRADIVRVDPDIVHVHSLSPLISPGVIDVAADSGAGVVATLHNFGMFCAGGMLLRDGRSCSDCLGGSALPGLRHGCYRDSRLATAPVTVSQAVHRGRSTWDRVDRFICPSHAVRDRHIAHGLSDRRLVVKPHFVDPMPSAATTHRAGALFVGRLDEAKGAMHLLDAWRALPDVGLDLVGDGPRADEAAAHPVAKRSNVRLLGKRSIADTLERIRDASIVVVPSLAVESFSLVLRDAMAMGKSIVAPERGAPAELLVHGRTGLLYQPGDDQALVGAVRRLVADPELADALRGAVRDEALRLLDADRNHDQLMEIYAAARSRAAERR